MSRQFAACKFRPDDRRTYTYHWDGEPLAPGDEVKVADRSGDGWTRVTVSTVTHRPPSFDTKPILGRVEPDQPDLLTPVDAS
jgi:hypothetical protein